MEFQELQKAMIQAMKDHDRDKKDAIASVVSAAKKMAIDTGCRDNISAELVNQAVLKELKTIKEQIDSCPDDRKELKDQYRKRYDTVNAFAPKLLSEDEIKDILNTKFADLLSSGNKGQVMKAVMAELKGKADGALISKAVGSLLQ